MKYKDYYRILELETSKVSIDEIRTAYRNAVKKYHPDVNAGDMLAEERIKDINEAYKTLSDPAQRKKYDKIWNSNNRIANYQKNRGRNIFSIFFGELTASIRKEDDNKPIRGENIETEINISLEDAFYGKGKIISFKTIDGNQKTYDVKIPAGIRNGEKIRLAGEGKEGKNGGEKGDLLIKINIENSKRFSLYGDDLYGDLKISPWEAALGTKLDLKTIDDNINVYIPQGTQSGEQIKIPNQGYKNGKGGRGNLILNVKIMVPKKLELDEEETFKKLKEMSNFNPREED